MLIQPIACFLLIWFVLAIISAFSVASDPYRNNLEPVVLNVGPGQRYDVVWKAQRLGKWLIHCHIPHHTTNNNVEERGGGGLMMVIDVS